MSLQNILVCDIFNILGIDFLVPFPKLFSSEYILVVVYVSKRDESIPTGTNDAKVVNQFFKINIFIRFSTPRAIM